MSIDVGRNATVVIELAVGLAVGMAAQTARRAHAELERAARLAASLEERERLSREVHDGAIQVLALVARRGREIGGPTAELAELAGEQERALQAAGQRRGQRRLPEGRRRPTWSPVLRSRASDRVSVSLPAHPVLARRRGRRRGRRGRGQRPRQRRRPRGRRRPGLRAARGSRRTRSWSASATTAVGIADGRLEEAVDEGRVGISKSIVGRMNWLGGSARLSTGPGTGPNGS